MGKKREPIKVIIVNPEAIPIARDRLTLELIKLQEKYLKESIATPKDELIKFKEV